MGVGFKTYEQERGRRGGGPLSRWLEPGVALTSLFLPLRPMGSTLSRERCIHRTRRSPGQCTCECGAVRCGRGNQVTAPPLTGVHLATNHRFTILIMADLDNKANTTSLENLLPPKLDHDVPILLLYLPKEIAEHSSEQLYGNKSFLHEKLSNPEKGPLLREKLVNAWEEKSSTSQLVGKWFTVVSVHFSHHLTDYL